MPDVDVLSSATAEPTTRPSFTLDGEHFTQLQFYNHSAFFIPKSPEIFHSTYPFANFKKWLSENDYKTMVTVLTDINRHCEVFQARGISPMIDLGMFAPAPKRAHKIVAFAGDAAVNIESLKEQLEIICEPSNRLDSPEAKTAREDAKQTLRILHSGSIDVKDECNEIITVTSQFDAETTQDEEALAALIAKLDVVLPPRMFEEAVFEKLRITRAQLSTLSERHKCAIQRDRDLKADLREMADSPRFLDVALSYQFTKTQTAQSMLEDCGYTATYNQLVAYGNSQKLELVKSIDNVRGVSWSIRNIGKYIKDAHMSLKNIMNGMNQLEANAGMLVRKLDNLSGQVKPEAAGSRRMSGLHADAAARACNVVLRVAGDFTEKGVIRHDRYPNHHHAPNILAAHYGGKNITSLANLLFVVNEEVIIDPKDVPLLGDPWPGNSKTLSLVYSFGDPATSLRVFVGGAPHGLRLVLTSGDLSGEPQGVTEAANLVSKKGGQLRIHAIVYGYRQITDPEVYERLYNWASTRKPVPITPVTFNWEPHDNLGWRIGKSAAVVYSYDGALRVMEGRDNQDCRCEECRDREKREFGRRHGRVSATRDEFWAQTGERLHMGEMKWWF
ncbi:hypothetical protein F5144DRAFT_481067 [Chaetomium tenue]|uniref:Uncharacterized protein n=1 Tax=Chaetomium tenue TaxID=1854479 RepID=A0ACB7PJV9_9PEZI|nr:hypothetical protein F5144DRAFT_481067 [Chaetomium globosum]